MKQCNFLGDYYFRGNCCLHLQDKLLPSRQNKTTYTINQMSKILAIHFLPKPMKNKTNYPSTSSEHSSFSKLQSLSRSRNSSLLWNLVISVFRTAWHGTPASASASWIQSNSSVNWTKCWLMFYKFRLGINNYNPLCPKWQLYLLFLVHPHNGLTF